MKYPVFALLTLLVFSYDVFDVGLVQREAPHWVQFRRVVHCNARVISSKIRHVGSLPVLVELLNRL